MLFRSPYFGEISIHQQNTENIESEERKKSNFTIFHVEKTEMMFLKVQTGSWYLPLKVSSQKEQIRESGIERTLSRSKISKVRTEKLNSNENEKMRNDATTRVSPVLACFHRNCDEAMSCLAMQSSKLLCRLRLFDRIVRV